MSQPSLFGTPAARRADPDTSHQAAKANPVERSELRHRVLWRLLMAHDFDASTPFGQRGRTDYELSLELNMPTMRGTVAKRRGDLVTNKLVEFVMKPDGGTLLRPTDTGSMAIVWRLTEAGVAMAESMGRPA